MGILKSDSEIEAMAEGGRRLADVMDQLKEIVAVGVTTKEIDARALELIKQVGCKPAFLGYKPYGARRAYPATICASVNESVVHGLPSDRRLENGDLLKIDIGLIHNDLYLDMAITIGVGDISQHDRTLIATTEEALYAGIKECHPDRTLGDVGYAIESRVHKNNFSVVESLTGHGIGKKLHEEPYVYNFGTKGQGMKLKPGMVIAIEPMVAIGSGDVRQLPDDSFSTSDGSRSAHFEHTVAITPTGPRILTKK
jgi:methionyl aminopeptidase